MAQIVDGIVSLLLAEPLISTFVDGGVWDRPLRRAGPNATPGAFQVDPPHLPKCSIAVIDGGEIRDPALPDVSVAHINLWVRVPDTADGRSRQEAILTGCVISLEGKVLGDLSGDVGMVEIQDRFPGQVDPWVEGGRMSYLRLRVAGYWSGMN